MNSHIPFDADNDWTIDPYHCNRSNDPLVDKVIGNAYAVVRAVYCNLGNLKLLYDFLNTYGMVLGVKSEAELKKLNKLAKYARIYGFADTGDRQVTDYLYVPDDTSGIRPDDPTATGSWIKVSTSSSGGGTNPGGTGSYIPYVYANGSALGGETSFKVPAEALGVPFLIINGSVQYIGYGFTFNAATSTVNLSNPLVQGDEVIALTSSVPANPDNPNVSSWVQINWLYNNGAAVGGEQVITVPYNFKDVPAVYKNGERYYKNLQTESYTFDPGTRTITMTEILAQGDRVIITLGGESTTIAVTDRTVQEVARSNNVKDSDVVLSTTTHLVITGKKILYDVSGQKFWRLPTLPPNAYIVKVDGSKLTYNPGSVTVELAEVGDVQSAMGPVLTRLAAESGMPMVGTFEDGANVTTSSQTVGHKAAGKIYKWTGSLPKSVAINTVPGSGSGWEDVTQSTLRNQLLNGAFSYPDATSIYDVPGVVINTTTDNRDAAYTHNKKIYVPAGVTLRVNFLPDDDVRKFVGEGKIITKNPWYNSDQTFDIEQATNGNGKSAKDTILGAIRLQSHISIGVVGDSISDGACGKQDWSSPPLDGNRNLLAPQSYNHSLAGGSHSWVAHWQWLMNMTQSRWSADPIFDVFNASLSGAKLSDGWGYRNFDYGFFGNAAYGAKAPQVCILAMGWNDSGADMDTYRDQIDMFVRKAWGYGCAVAIVTVNDNDPRRIGFEAATKRQMCERLGIDYFSLGEELTKLSNTNMQGMYYYYTKKEPQYDTTHPQELGQMAMGNAMYMQTLGEKYVLRVKPGDIINPSVVENYWDAVTYPSNKHLVPSYGRSSGTPKLVTFGYLPMAQTAGENVKFVTFVYCEEEGMSLTVLEPWTGDGKVGDNNHLKVVSPPGKDLAPTGTYADRNTTINAYRVFCVGKLASSYYGGKSTLSTYAGRLRKGLNMIQIINGGQLPTVWYPGLKFGKTSSDGIRLPKTRLTIGQSAAPSQFIADGSQFDDGVLSNVLSGRPSAQLPNGYIRQGALVGRIRVDNGLPLNTYIAANHDALLNQAILIGVASDGRMAAGTWNTAEPTDWAFFGDATTTNFVGKPFTIWVYTASDTGAYNFYLTTDDGRISNQLVKATTLVTGGSVGVFKRTAGSYTVELEASTTFTNIG